MSTNLEYRARERQRKRESRRQASEAQREKGRQRFRARDKKQRRHFFVGRTTWKFCSGGDKMRNASGHQCKEKMSGSEKKKVNENTYDISSLKTLRWLLRLFVIIDKNHKVVVIEKNCDSVHRQWIDYPPFEQLGPHSALLSKTSLQCPRVLNAVLGEDQVILKVVTSRR